MADFPALAGLSPWTRREWAEDEKYAQTFHAKVNEIQELTAMAAASSPAEKERYAQTIADRLNIETNAVLRQRLVRGLGDCNGVLAFQTLSIYSGDLDSGVRTAACEAFGKLQTPESAQALANVISNDKDLDVRLAAARELTNYPNNPDAIRSLGAMLDDANPAAQYRAVQSLRVVTRRDLGDSVAAWREYVQSGDAFAPRPPLTVVERVKKWF